MVKRFLVEEEGQALVEYGLLTSLIALVSIAAVALLGTRIKHSFDVASGALNGPCAICGQVH